MPCRVTEIPKVEVVIRGSSSSSDLLEARMFAYIRCIVSLLFRAERRRDVRIWRGPCGTLTDGKKKVKPLPVLQKEFPIFLDFLYVDKPLAKDTGIRN